MSCLKWYELTAVGEVFLPSGASWWINFHPELPFLLPGWAEHQGSSKTSPWTSNSGPASLQSLNAGNSVFTSFNSLSVSNQPQDSSVIPMLTLAKHCCVLVNNWCAPSQSWWCFGVIGSVLCVVYKSLLQPLQLKIISECKDKIASEAQGWAAHPPREQTQISKLRLTLRSVPLHSHEISEAERKQFVLNFK